MRLLARHCRLFALALACAALFYAPRSSTLLLPGPRRRLWEVWPQLHNATMPCWRCGKPRWAEDLAVFRRLWGGYVAVCDGCLAQEAHCGISS